MKKYDRLSLVLIVIGALSSILFAILAQSDFVWKSAEYALRRSAIAQCEYEGQTNGWTQWDLEAYDRAVSAMNSLIASSKIARLHSNLARWGFFGNSISVLLTLAAASGDATIILFLYLFVKEECKKKRRRRYLSPRVR